MAKVPIRPFPVEHRSSASSETQPQLEQALRGTIEALTGLDANRLEALVQGYGCKRMTAGVAQVEPRVRDAKRILRCFLAQTRRNLQLLVRLTQRRSEEHSPPACNLP